jgi:hypothetical protein
MRQHDREKCLTLIKRAYQWTEPSREQPIERKWDRLENAQKQEYEYRYRHADQAGGDQPETDAYRERELDSCDARLWLS